MAAGRHYIPLVLLMLMIGGCESQRIGVLEGLLSGDEDDWLYRDPAEDPYEWQNGTCCNDYNPVFLPLDTTISAAINPADDLDYYHINLTERIVGLLRIAADTDALGIRLFARDAEIMNEEFEIVVDSLWLDIPSGTETVATAYQWTYIVGWWKNYRLLIQGDGSAPPVAYQMEWQKVIPTVGLDLISPVSPATWQRGELQTIEWHSSFSGGVTIGLISSVGMVKILKRDVDTASKLNWTPKIELIPGGYRIAVYLTDDPTVVEVSDVITIQ